MQPWPGMRRGAEEVVPSVPGFVSEIDVPRKASGSIVPRRALPTRLSNVATNSAKSSSSAILMFGTRRVRRAVLLRHVDRDAEVHVGLPDALRAPLGLGVGVVHPGVLLERPDDRPGDEVREGDLRLAHRLAVVVQDPPVLLHRLDRDDPLRGRGRDGEGGVHVAGDRRGAADEGLELLAGPELGRRPGGARAARRGTARRERAPRARRPGAAGDGRASGRAPRARGRSARTARRSSASRRPRSPGSAGTARRARGRSRRCRRTIRRGRRGRRRAFRVFLSPGGPRLARAARRARAGGPAAEVMLPRPLVPLPSRSPAARPTHANPRNGPSGRQSPR